MSAHNVLPFPACEAFPLLEQPSAEPPRADFARIEFLRGLLQESLLHSRRDLERACDVITTDKSRSVRAHALALFATLSEHASQRLTFYRAGTKQVSASEIWLLRLLDAYRDADTPQGRALIAWRVRPLGHRRVRFLVGGLASALLEMDARTS
ncbi:MAG: hypothetical protein AAFZ01_01865 [Pseudomonadota bacterium]